MSSHSLRQQAARLRAGRPRRSARYPDEFRHQVVQHTRSGQAQGRPLKEIAREVGLPWQTVHRWLDQAPRLRRVRLAAGPERSSAARLTLVTSQGLRVEGLTVEDLAALLRRLG